MTQTLRDLLASHPPDAPAIGAPDRPWLSHGDLARLAGTVGRDLAAHGLRRGDRVAIVLPNGPEMAAAFVTLATHLTTAPLNPAYREEEFDFYLDDLGARALLVAADEEGPAVRAARRRGLAILRLAVDPGRPAGWFALAGEGGSSAADPLPAGEADDVALVLHTSGTTSRPKIVPLLQRNLAASARHIADTLTLTSADRCLNVMPLFHIHGLVAAVLASLSAGASVWCAPGFNALQMFGWLRTVDPTWYTAVPTMHQAILARAGRNREILEALSLRFIRSSSAPLPAPVMTELSATFGCPVVESYGMTEAAHQMTSNPIAPGTQKPGSVGRAAGPAVTLADEAADRLLDPEAIGPDGTGEVVIAGDNVTPGYEANADANARAFFRTDGRRWFRTGDQGRFDADGYLTITGRLKEIINRGGEKVSPIEVDSVLLEHPDVVQAVTFALPHDKLGEEVAAAVVAAPGAVLEAAALRAFAAGRLADFKVPRRVVIVDEIPKGATGKLQRIGLAAKLGLV